MKKHTPDNIGEVTFTTNNSALILWRTRVVNYLFANYLNQCYDLRLWRDDDLSLSQFIPALSSLPPCPLWYYFDNSSQLFYLLIDINGCQRQLGNSFVYHDKLLFLYGRDSWDKMHQIYRHFTLRLPPSDAHDLLALHSHAMLQTARNVVEKVDYYDARLVPVSGDKMLTDPTSDDYDTSLLAGVRHPFPKDLRRNMALFNDRLLDILAAIEINLQSMEV